MGQASAIGIGLERQSSVAGVSGFGAIREMATSKPLPRVLDPSIRRQLEPTGGPGLPVPNGGKRCGAGERALRSHKVDRDGLDVIISNTRGITSPTIKREMPNVRWEDETQSSRSSDI